MKTKSLPDLFKLHALPPAGDGEAGVWGARVAGVGRQDGATRVAGRAAAAPGHRHASQSSVLWDSLGMLMFTFTCWVIRINNKWLRWTFFLISVGISFHKNLRTGKITILMKRI